MTLFWAKMPYQIYQLSGTDAYSFIQGQITQDINCITADTCHYSAYCNHKGRMFANMLIFADDSSLYLRVHESVAEKVIKRLQMFILRADVSIEKTGYVSLGVSAKVAKSLCEKSCVTLPEDFHTAHMEETTLCALPNGYYELQCHPKTLIHDSVTALNEDSDSIMQTFMLGGHFDIVETNSESILPQQTTLETWGGINYTKGCYVGQEIIARNKYLGKLKNTLAVAITPPNNSVEIGDEVTLNDRSVGKIIAYHKGKTQNYYQSIMAIDSVGQECIICGQPITFQSV